MKMHSAAIGGSVNCKKCDMAIRPGKTHKCWNDLKEGEHFCKYCEYKCTCNRGQVYEEDCDGCGCNYRGWD